MSGGVDSSVAAALLRDAGHEVVGVTMKLWGGESDTGCCSVADVDDARRVAQQLGLDHVVFNFGDDFAAHVVEPYLEAHVAGRTPNPCVECNRHLKFARLAAAGRAARLRRPRHRPPRPRSSPRRAGGGRRLARGADRAKDQSYVLHMLGQRDLARTLLPVGELRKAEVASASRRARPADGGQGRQPGRLLHHVAARPPGLRRRPPAAARGHRRRHRRSPAGRGPRGRAGDGRAAQGLGWTGRRTGPLRRRRRPRRAAGSPSAPREELLVDAAGRRVDWRCGRRRRPRVRSWSRSAPTASPGRPRSRRPPAAVTVRWRPAAAAGGAGSERSWPTTRPTPSCSAAGRPA